MNKKAKKQVQMIQVKDKFCVMKILCPLYKLLVFYYTTDINNLED